MSLRKSTIKAKNEFDPLKELNLNEIQNFNNNLNQKYNLNELKIKDDQVYIERYGDAFEYEIGKELSKKYNSKVKYNKQNSIQHEIVGDNDVEIER